MPKFEVRCHEWGDGSDYHWDYYSTFESAVKEIKRFYDNDPNNVYEHLYIVEIGDDGSRKPMNVDVR